MDVLIVDDDEAGRKVAVYNLRKAGYGVDEAANGASGLQLFDAQRHAVVITDLKMPGVDGLELLATIHKQSPGTPVIVITAFGNVDVAVAAMREGAWDFLQKPFSRDLLELTVQRAGEASTLRRDNRRLRAMTVERPMVVQSGAMRRVLEVVDRVALSSATVLVSGESGVGKELVARRVHGRSQRSSSPFVAVNCAAIPAALLESELFGHSKGAFTGATKARLGRFRAADGGTLFLDEISELPLELQSKLLRVLEDGRIDVVGRDEPLTVDVRVVAATNTDLQARVADGTFRKDLFFRLNVIGVEVPPLRERKADVMPLALAFLHEFSGGRELDVPSDVADELKRRHWPGNVRELRNACERLAILCVGKAVRFDDLPPKPGMAGADSWLDHLPEGMSLMDVEMAVVVHSLKRHNGNVSAAARALGVPRHVLAYRILKYGIEADE